MSPLNCFAWFVRVATTPSANYRPVLVLGVDLSCFIYRPPVWIGLADSLSNDPLPGRGRSGEQVTSEMAQSHYIVESADGQARLESCDRIKSSQIEGVEEFLIPLGHHRPLDLQRRCEFAALDGQAALQQGPLRDRFPPVVVGRLRIPLRRRRELPANQVWVAYLGVTPLLTSRRAEGHRERGRRSKPV